MGSGTRKPEIREGIPDFFGTRTREIVSNQTQTRLLLPELITIHYIISYVVVNQPEKLNLLGEKKIFHSKWFTLFFQKSKLSNDINIEIKNRSWVKNKYAH